MSNKRLVSLFSLTAAASMVLAACGQAAPAAPTAVPAKPTEAAKPAATAAPAQPTAAAKPAGKRGAGDTVRILYWQAPTILNAHLAAGTKDFDAARLILEPLAGIGAEGVPVPALAAEIPTVANGGVSKDLTTVTWKLRKDVKWSDGTPFTADDVVFTYDYCADKATACATASSFAGIKSVEAVDPATVKVTFATPTTNPYRIFVSTQGYILQKKQFGACIGAKASTDSACQAANNAPIGTGPYKLKDFKSGDTVLYSINDNYRDADKPFFKEVLFKGGGDATSAARAAFQTGDTDYAWNLQVEWAVLDQLAKTGGKAVLVNTPGANVERIMFQAADPSPEAGDKRGEPDTKHPFFQDKNVRQALAMAIDRKTMAEQLYGQTGDPTCELITTDPFISPSKVYGGIRKCEPDIEGAKKLLDAAGWKPGPDGIRVKDGKKFKVTFNTSTNTLRQKEQALVKDAWAAIGVDTELKNVSATVFFSTDASNNDTTGKFFNDVQMYTNNYSQPDPTDYLCDFTTSQISAKANAWRGPNNIRYSNPEYDKLCTALRGESDDAKRKDIVLKMNDLLMTDYYVVPLISRKRVSAIAKDLKGVKGTPWDSEMWDIADWTK
jgi:peptide/nickel transport system substrate-binding protein